MNVKTIDNRIVAVRPASFRYVLANDFGDCTAEVVAYTTSGEVVTVARKEGKKEAKLVEWASNIVRLFSL